MPFQTSDVSRLRLQLSKCLTALNGWGVVVLVELELVVTWQKLQRKKRSCMNTLLAKHIQSHGSHFWRWFTFFQGGICYFPARYIMLKKRFPCQILPKKNGFNKKSSHDATSDVDVVAAEVDVVEVEVDVDVETDDVDVSVVVVMVTSMSWKTQRWLPEPKQMSKRNAKARVWLFFLVVGGLAI